VQHIANAPRQDFFCAMSIVTATPRPGCDDNRPPKLLRLPTITNPIPMVHRIVHRLELTASNASAATSRTPPRHTAALQRVCWNIRALHLDQPMRPPQRRRQRFPVAQVTLHPSPATLCLAFRNDN
jgi:hypothetical protein